MKTQIELSCFEENLFECLNEVKKIMSSLEIQVIQLKVKVRHTDKEPASESWVQLTLDSYPPEVLEIYQLKKHQRQQEGFSRITNDIKKIIYDEKRTETEKLNDILKFFPLR